MLESSANVDFSGSSTAVLPSSVKSPTDEELGAFYYNLSQSGTKSSISSLVPQYCNDYIPRIENMNVLLTHAVRTIHRYLI